MYESNRDVASSFYAAVMRCTAAALLVSIVVVSPTRCCAQPTTQRPPVAASANNTQLYFFTNHGCAPCRQVEPSIKALADEGYPVTTIFLDEQPEWGQRFSVDRTPTVILIKDQKIVGRHAGLIDQATLKQWFDAVGVGQPTEQFAAHQNRAQPSTLHQGTRQPENSNEQRALNATVRLKVEDPEGISYATGTVIHCHAGEWLVMTCGHVFRESKGSGKITAEFDFEGPQTKSAPGQLLAYDSDARDIGLIVVQAGQAIEPVMIASSDRLVEKGVPVFSIGCDQGASPTIRHSQIKNRAAYDGAEKYDIFGRPVNGRSGGGLFNQAGELIGVCNAARFFICEWRMVGLAP